MTKLNVLPRKPQRFHYMDNLRAILMLSGVLMHSMLFLTPFKDFHEWPIHNPITRPIYFDFVLLIHIWYMPLFYLIGGYFARLIFNRYGTVQFIGKRLFRIGLPFLICFLLLSLYHTGDLVSYLYEGKKLSLQNYYDLYGFIGPLWFIYFLLYFYFMALLLQWLSHFIFKGKLQLHAAAFWVLFALFGFGLFYFTNNISLDPPLTLSIKPQALFFYFSFFLFGWILKARTSDLKFFSDYGWAFLLTALFLTFPCYLWIYYHPAYYQLYPALKIMMMFLNPVSSWLLTLGLLGCFYRFVTINSKFLRYLADASYTFYLIQVPIVLLVQAFFIFHNLPMFLKLIYVYVISLGIMTIFYTLLVRKTLLGVLLNGERK